MPRQVSRKRAREEPAEDVDILGGESTSSTEAEEGPAPMQLLDAVPDGTPPQGGDDDDDDDDADTLEMGTQLE